MIGLSNLDSWLDKKTELHDTIRIQPAQFMEATLDKKPKLKVGDKLPQLWHWLYFLEAKPESELGRDAHPRKGDFLPPIELPRRMWAGGRFFFHKDLTIGSVANKISSIKNISEKDGKSGPLCFVTIEHKIYSENELCITEEQDLVYLQDKVQSQPSKPAKSMMENADFRKKIIPSEILLFRYSALTFNGHRIHYDVDYSRSVEGYDGLVFHGPLTATLLLELAIKHSNEPINTYSFKGKSPLTNLQEFWIEGKFVDEGITLWAKRRDGNVAMEASALF